MLLIIVWSVFSQRDYLCKVIAPNATFFSLGSQANWYRPASFSQYKMKQSKRKRRELVPPPVSMSNEFYSNIALQVKVEPTPHEVVVFLASNSLGTEFNRIDVCVILCISGVQYALDTLYGSLLFACRWFTPTHFVDESVLLRCVCVCVCVCVCINLWE